MSKSKKQSKKTPSKKAQAKTAKARGAATQPAAKREGAPEAAALELRLPPVGTIIKKVDRYQNVRCQCTVVEDGVRYKGHVYRSLSGAAMAAAQDLGLKNKTQNGFTFWGITKPARKLADPLAALTKSWERFHGVAAIVTAGATDQNRAQLRSALHEQGQAIENLLGQVAQ